MKGVINIIGVIGEDVLLQHVIQQVKEQPKATEFTVYINSIGGAVSVGFDIYDYLRGLGKPIKTVGLANVMSIATVIFLAGDEREVQSNTEFMIHLPMLLDDAPKRAKELRSDAREMAKIERDIINFYEDNTLLERNELAAMMSNDVFLSPDELFAFGFTTEKIPIKAVAKLILNSDNKMSKKGGLLEKVKALLSGNVVMTKTLKTAEQGDLVFTDLAEDGVVNVGDYAEIDGQPAEGEVVLADGTIYNFVDGVLESIVEVSAEGEDDLTELIEKIDEIQSVTETLVEVVEEIQGNVEQVKEEVVAKLIVMKDKLAKATQGASQSATRKAVARQSTQPTNENRLVAAINRLKK